MRSRILLLLAFAISVPVLAQETPEKPAAPPKTAILSPRARIAAAKTVYLKNLTPKSDMAFSILQNAVVGWPELTIVDAPEKADITIEMSAPYENKDKDDTKVGGGTGQQQQQSPAPIADPNVRLMVRDAHSRAMLWNTTEPVKDALRQSKIDENMIDATNKCVLRLHDVIEPPPPSAQKQPKQ